MRTAPSISGASAAQRAIAVVPSCASTSTVIVCADAPREPGGADPRLHRHEARAAIFLDFFGHRIGQRIRRGAVDRRIGEAADAIELRGLEKREQFLELALGLAGKAGDERTADHEIADAPRATPRSAAACLRRSPGASSASGCAGSRAGTARRDRGGGRRAPDRPSSARSPRRRADTGRHNGAAPTRRGRAPTRRALPRARSSASSPAGPARTRCGSGRRHRRRSCPAR